MVSMLANIVLLFIMPYTAPYIWLLIATRTLISLFNTVLETSPLVVDYVKKDSRGTAVALGTIGMLTGEGFGMAVLLGLTIGMRIEDAHAYVAVILFVLTISISFCLREPRIRAHEKIEEESLQEATKRLSCWEKTKYLTDCVKQEINKDFKYLFCFVAAMVTKLVQVLYSVYLILWITDFVERGVLQDNDEAKTLYKNVMVYAVIATAISVPFIGKMVDYLPAPIFVPLSFLIRGVLIL